MPHNHKQGYNENQKLQHHGHEHIHQEKRHGHDKHEQEPQIDDYHFVNPNGQTKPISQVVDVNRQRSLSTKVHTGDLAREGMNNRYYDYDMDSYEDAYDFMYKHKWDHFENHYGVDDTGISRIGHKIELVIMVTNITALIISCCCVYLVIAVCLSWFGVRMGRKARKRMDDQKYESGSEIANILDQEDVPHDLSQV